MKVHYTFIGVVAIWIGQLGAIDDRIISVVIVVAVGVVRGGEAVEGVVVILNDRLVQLGDWHGETILGGVAARKPPPSIESSDIFILAEYLQ